MSSPSPSIYLLYGNDEFAIRSFLDERLKAKMGESSDTTMDITSLDGRQTNLEAIKAETHTIPFLNPSTTPFGSAERASPGSYLVNPV